MVPENNVASCGMIAKDERRSLRPNWLRSSPSITIDPPQGSTTLNKASIREDFPAPNRLIRILGEYLPVLPTTPIFSEGLISAETPSSTKGRPSRYLSERFLKEMAPLAGQEAGGL